MKHAAPALSCPRPRVTSRPMGLPHKGQRRFVIRAHGRIVGELVGRRDVEDGVPVFQVHGADVVPGHQRCGYGTKLYAAAARWACANGMQLQSDYARSAASEGFWAKQVAKGRATCAVPADPALTEEAAPATSSYGRGGCGAYRLKPCPAPRSLAGARGLGEVRNVRDVPPHLDSRVRRAEDHARSIGATGELEYVGMGAEGTVLCDTRGRAYKVAHRGQSIADEAAYLKAASEIPGVREHVAKFIAYHPGSEVLVRACPQPYVSPRGERRRQPPGRKLAELHEEIGRRMRAYGWGRPEFKQDAYVLTRSGPVLVDAGFAVKRGRALVREALDIINGRRAATPMDIVTAGFEIRMERGDTIPAPVANRLLRRLKALNPEVDAD